MLTNNSYLYMMEEYLSVKEVGDRLGLTENTIRHYIKLRRIKACKPANKYLITAGEITAFIKTHFKPVAENERK